MRFYVTGHGHFPIDMLRYDRCWPTINNRNDVFQACHREPITVELETDIPEYRLTPGRWSSFGWAMSVFHPNSKY